MPISKIAPFKIENIDQTYGQCAVRFINKYGPIYTGEKTLDDFLSTIEIATGDYNNDGTQIFATRQIMITDNPNEDLIQSVDIPIDDTGNYIGTDALLEHIAKHYPHDQFENNYKRKNAVSNPNLDSLINQDFEITIEYPDPVNIIENVYLERETTPPPT